MSDEFRIDHAAFVRGLNLADANVRRLATRGVAKCAAEVERQAKELAPIAQIEKVPYTEGRLMIMVLQPK